MLCGAAIRIAECMGLHRDGTEYGLGPVETHVRRMIWYTLGGLDIRTCEAQGPRPVIRPADFDTQFPLNVDDDELESPHPPTESARRWTDVTLSLIRWECLELHRVIWFDRPRLEQKTMTLTAVLAKVENFRRMMKDKYLSWMDDSDPVQYYGRQLVEVLSLRLHAMVLHRYHNGITFTVPGTCAAVPCRIRGGGTEPRRQIASVKSSSARGSPSPKPVSRWRHRRN